MLSIFLFRVQDYEFVDGFKIPELKSVKVEGGGSGPPPGRPGPPDLAQMNKERDAKMARFRYQFFRHIKKNIISLDRFVVRQ